MAALGALKVILAGTMIDRRTLLAAGTAAALASTVAAAPRPRRTIKKALKYGMIRDGTTVLEKFEIAAAVGFDGVELDSPSELDLEQVLAAQDATGLVIPGVVDSVHWRDTLGDPDPAVRARGVAGLETALRDCAAYGGTTVLLVPGVVNVHMPYHLVYERSQAEIKKVLPLAEELGIRIAFENVWNNFITDADEAARYVDQFDSPYIGWYFDTGNIVRYGEPAQWVKTLGKRMMKLDIKDYSRAKMKAEGVWKGFGCKIGDPDSSVGWADTMRAVDAIGYSGWGSAEVGGGKRDRLEDISRRMDDVFSR